MAEAWTDLAYSQTSGLDENGHTPFVFLTGLGPDSTKITCQSNMSPWKGVMINDHNYLRHDETRLKWQPPNEMKDLRHILTHQKATQFL